MNTQLGNDVLYGQAHTLRRDGYEVRYWDGGIRDGPALVFSHGAGLDHRLFEPQVRHCVRAWIMISEVDRVTADSVRGGFRPPGRGGLRP